MKPFRQWANINSGRPIRPKLTPWTLVHLTSFAILTILISLVPAGCHSAPKTPLSFSERVGLAHGRSEWQSRQVLIGDIHAEFITGPIFDAHFIYETRTGRCRLLLPDNTVLVYDGESIWVSPTSSPISNAKVIFNTWPLFVAAPFHFTQPDANMTTPTRWQGMGQTYDVSRVNLPGNDWRMLYVDAESHRLFAMAYPRPIQAGGEGPQAITYYDFKDFDGVTLAVAWRFWQWNQIEGIYGKPIGSGRIYNVDFASPPMAKPFERPVNSRLAD